MNAWHWFWLIFGVIAIGPACYALHRLALWLEAHGQLYYKHKKPESSSGGVFTAFQQFIEPSVKHVIEVKNDRTERQKEEEDEKDKAAN